MELTCYGQSGHGSLFLKNTPGKKIQFLINKFMEFRDVEEEKLEMHSDLRIGDVTTVNLTMINGGIQNNVIPGEMSIVFDIRLAVDVDHVEFERMVMRKRIPKLQLRCSQIVNCNFFWIRSNAGVRKPVVI